MAAVMAFSTGVTAFAEDGFISLAPIEEPEEIISEEKIFEEIEYIEEETELLNASAENSLEEIIRPQIEAYAKSIDQNGADKKATDALASWGMSKKGKTLNIDEKHAFTATLLNSELMKFVLSEALLQTFMLVKNPKDIERSYIACGYYKNAWYDYKIYEKDVRIKYVWHEEYSTPYGSYDKSLELLGGTVEGNVTLKLNKISADKAVYDVKLVIFDRFDFNTAGDSALKNILGILGALLFTPFNWNATVNFQIEVPNDCEHSYESVVKNPVCTEKGSVTYTCALCGYSYTEEIAAKDHSLGEWSLYAEPTLGNAGEERRTCANCDYYESKEIAAYRYGDVNCDGKVNTVDANYVRRYSAGLLTLGERQMLAADVDGNGAINVLDSAIIRRYVVKYITSLPHKETA